MNNLRKSLSVSATIGVALSVVLWTLQIAYGDHQSGSVGHFEPLATYHVSGEVAEIVACTPDGDTLIYTDSASQVIGFVDISNPALPAEISTLAAGGEPTSVAVTPGGRWALAVVHGSPDQLLVIDLRDRTIERTLVLGGQPDSIAISPDGWYAAVVIENERDEDVDDGRMPQPPPGFLTIVRLFGPPSFWSTRTVSLTGFGNRFPTDPEPEFVDINDDHEAAVTLQENNTVVIVDLERARVIEHWSAGTTTHPADLQNDGFVIFDDVLLNARREPDAVVWTPRGNLITANEGDYTVDLATGEFVGGRNFTIFSRRGNVVFDAGSSLEEAAAAVGLYSDSRSASKGCEIEGAEIGVFDDRTFAFIGSERCNFVAVYRLDFRDKPRLIQILSTGDRPEGLLAIPRRDLFVTANEGDGTISIFKGRPGNP
jgi:DNA-binding beta-propeller fold protein YncE